MRAAHILNVYRRYRSGTGIVGVAYGPKEVSGVGRNNECSVAFFVREKLPVSGAKRTLRDGRRRLPKFVEIEGERIPTDVVTTDATTSTDPATRSPPGIYRAGGKVSNRQLTGTIGCLVSSSVRPGIYAITNQHIGLSEGTLMAFPDFQSIGAIVGTTATSVGLVADEIFLPPFDRPQAYVDVDCALIRIPPNFENRFVNDIPRFGTPSSVYVPNIESPAAFVNSFLNLPVYAYGWPSGPRSGTISHVYYVYRQASGMEQVATLLVASTDGASPGVLGDSGKLWMTRRNDQNVGVGIHSGVVADSPVSSRFAMVTELSSLMRFLNIRLLT